MTTEPEDITEPFEREIFVLTKRIEKALDIVSRYGGDPNLYHTRWMIDQVVRVLADSGYDEWVREYNDAGQDLAPWDEGIAP